MTGVTSQNAADVLSALDSSSVPPSFQPLEFSLVAHSFRLVLREFRCCRLTTQSAATTRPTSAPCSCPSRKRILLSMCLSSASVERYSLIRWIDYSAGASKVFVRQLRYQGYGDYASSSVGRWAEGRFHCLICWFTYPYLSQLIHDFG